MPTEDVNVNNPKGSGSVTTGYNLDPRRIWNFCNRLESAPDIKEVRAINAEMRTYFENEVGLRKSAAA